MTRVIYNRQKDSCEITVCGHAYETANPDGNRVCAALSILSQTLSSFLLQSNAKIAFTIIEDGYFKVGFKTNKALMIGVNAIMCGFKHLAANYDNVTYTIISRKQ